MYFTQLFKLLGFFCCFANYYQMFAMGKENLVHIGYNGQKCSFVGDTEYLMWYNISFIWENTVFCSPQNVVSQYVSFHKDRLKDFQAPRLLCCANISFHEVGLLAETVNQCRPKTPPRENPFTFKPGEFSALGDSEVS